MGESILGVAVGTGAGRLDLKIETRNKFKKHCYITFCHYSSVKLQKILKKTFYKIGKKIL